MHRSDGLRQTDVFLSDGDPSDKKNRPFDRFSVTGYTNYLLRLIVQPTLRLSFIEISFPAAISLMASFK